MSLEQSSPRPSRHHASEVDANGMMLEEDDTTSPVGYRWLHANCAPKSFLPRHSHFLSPVVKETKRYHGSQTVLSSESMNKIPQIILEHVLWALDNEGIELQVLKMSILNRHEELNDQLVCHAKTDCSSPDFRRIWFLYEFFLNVRIPVPDVAESCYPILLLDPEVYVTGPCYHIVARQRHVSFLNLLTRRIGNNLLGTQNFHPLARKSLLGTTSSIKEILRSRTSEFSMDVRVRAASYNRLRETQSTFRIEQEPGDSP